MEFSILKSKRKLVFIGLFLFFRRNRPRYRLDHKIWLVFLPPPPPPDRVEPGDGIIELPSHPTIDVSRALEALYLAVKCYLSERDHLPLIERLELARKIYLDDYDTNKFASTLFSKEFIEEYLVEQYYDLSNLFSIILKGRWRPWVRIDEGNSAIGDGSFLR